jgi:hypothetical protein
MSRNTDPPVTPRASPGGPLIRERWSAWGWPPDVIADLFQAAADYWRAASWRPLHRLPLLAMRPPGGREWTVSAFGDGIDEERGLLVFLSGVNLPHEGTRNAAEVVAPRPVPGLSLVFVPRTSLAPAAVEEIDAAGWETAGPSAYPEICPIRPPEGGVPAAWIGMLAAGLRAATAFASRHAELLDEELEPLDDPLRWTDPATGAEFETLERYDEDDDPIWVPPRTLAPALPAGPAADPGVALEPYDEAAQRVGDRLLVRRYRSRLERDGTASDIVERRAADATLFLRGLAEARGVALQACTEPDLRVVLYDWILQSAGLTGKQAAALAEGLGPFFTYLASDEGLELPWALPIVGDLDGLAERERRRPKGSDPKAVARWARDLDGDLDARALTPSVNLGLEGEWSARPGPVEAALRRELARRWLLWRDDVIAGGTSGAAALHVALQQRQREWERAPHAGYGGRTPVDLIEEERARGPGGAGSPPG